MFFLWCWIANLTTLFALSLILKSVQVQPDISLYMKYRWFFFSLLAAYLFVLPFSFQKDYGAYCDDTVIYPNVMAFLPMAYLTMVIFVIYLRYNNYFINWLEHEKIPLSNTEDYTSKDLFEQQMNKFLCT